MTSSRTKDRHYLGPNLVLRRYMTFARFAHLLLTKNLFLARLSEMDDPWEGAFPRLTLERLNAADGGTTSQGEMSKAVRLRTFVNCWHASRIESMAMWDRYASTDAGVCVVSTAQRLVNALLDPHDSIRIGRVQYIDFEHLDVDDNAGVGLLKPIPYAYEREVRLIRVDLPSTPTTEEPGYSVTIDPSAMITSIVLSPRTRDWELTAAKKLTESSIARAIPVTRSQILTPPWI